MTLVGVMAAILAAAALTISKKTDLTALYNNIFAADPRYLAAAFICMAGFICYESLNIKRTLDLLENRRCSLLQNLKYGAAGFFFSGITPSATGGQPMQIYYMHHDGIEVSHGAIALVLEGLSYQISLMFFAIFGIIYNTRYIMGLNAALKTVLFFCMAVNVAVIAFLLGVLFSRRAADAAERLLSAAAEKLHRPKWKTSIENQFHEYRNCSEIIKEHPGLPVRNVATALVQLALMFSVTYFVYLALGCSGSGCIRILTLQAVLTAGMSLVPIPGNTGTGEAAFQLVFSSVFPDGKLIPGMILSRGISVYAGILLTGVFLAALKTAHLFRPQPSTEGQAR